MPIDANIALGYKPADGMQTLSSMLNVQSQQQGIQARNLAMQGQQQQNTEGQISLQERQNLQPLLSDPSGYTDARGDIDWNKAMPMVMRAAPTTGMGVLQHMAQAQQQRTSAMRTIANQTDENNIRAGSALASSTPETVEKTLGVVSQMYPGDDMKNVLSQFGQHLKTGLLQAKDDPAAQSKLIQSAARMLLPQPTQQDMATPGGVAVDNGQQSSIVSTKPGTAVPAGQSLPGTSVQRQLPPNTPVMGADASGAPTPGYLGPQGSAPQPGRLGSPEANGSATTSASTHNRLGILQQELESAKTPEDRAAIQREMSRLGGKPSSFVASGLPVGQSENISNNVQEMNRHFSGLQDQAAGSQLVAGLTGNIKALANKAITGTNGDKLAYANGLLAQLGIGKSEDLKTATDLLEKNMAQLSLGSGGSTDAARTLVQAARPNSHMTPEAIGEAADQVAGQVKANVAMRNMLQPLKLMGDVDSYSKTRTRLEGIADPRAFQFADYGPQQQVEMLKRLTPQDRAGLRSKIQKLEELHMFGK